MTNYLKIVGSSLVGAVLCVTPAHAWVEYGAFYQTPHPNSQMYYQPMYAYASAPVLNSYQSYPNYGGQQAPRMNTSQNNYYDINPSAYAYANRNYMPQYTYSYTYPQYNAYYPQPANNPYAAYAPYGQNIDMYGNHVPYSYGYPTGETVPWLGGQLCTFPDYEGRALCGSNPSQRVYDSWTGTWY